MRGDDGSTAAGYLLWHRDRDGLPGDDAWDDGDGEFEFGWGGGDDVNSIVDEDEADAAEDDTDDVWLPGEDEIIVPEDHEGFAMSDEWLAMFAATEARRAGKVRERRREARRLERPRVPAAEAADAKVAAVLAARRAAEEADTHTMATDDGVDGKVPVGGPEEMYGKEGAARVAALEAELNAAYDEAVDRRKPRHWPAIALNPIDT